MFKYSKNFEKSKRSAEKDESFCIDAKQSVVPGRSESGCLATTQGGDLNRQPEGQRLKPVPPGDTADGTICYQTYRTFDTLYFSGYSLNFET